MFLPSRRIKPIVLTSKDCLFLESTGIFEAGNEREKNNLTDKARNTSTRHGQGRSQDFSRGKVTLCQSEGTHQIVMSFSLPLQVVSLKRPLTKEKVGGGGQHGHPTMPPSWGLTLSPVKVACTKSGSHMQRIYLGHV